MTWYNDIEEAVIRREGWHSHRTVLEPFERLVLDAEARVLARTKNGFCPAIYTERVQEYVYTESGKMHLDEVQVVKHNADYIAGEIQRLLPGHNLTKRGIYDVLISCSSVFTAADIQNVPVVVRLHDGRVTHLEGRRYDAA